MPENSKNRGFFFSSNFKETVKNYYYVDKSLLIKDFIDEHPQVSLITRPRRFGKSLNMDMLKTFFEKTEGDTSVYFRDLKIWNCGEKYMSEQGKYPVVYLNFGDCSAKTWDKLYDLLKDTIAAEYLRHKEELQGLMDDDQTEAFLKISKKTGSDSDFSKSLNTLTELLNKCLRVAPVVLIDEYDVPIQKGFDAGCFSDVVEFMRNFFTSGLKDNPNLGFAVLTGVTRISQASLFTGLNNLVVYSVLDAKYSQYYGFTEGEVKAMLRDFDAEDRFDDVCDWYDGYRFGDTEIFNPWSVESFINCRFRSHSHWIKTSSMGELKAVLKNATKETEDNLELVASGKRIKAAIDDHTSYDELWKGDKIYTLLLFCGYLTKCVVSEEEEEMLDDDEYWLVIPNKEVGKAYRKEILEYLNGRYEGVGDFSKRVLEALEKEDVRSLQSNINLFMEKYLSTWDNDEKFYHGLFMGIIGCLGDGYDMKSNREHGRGRPDLTIDSFGYGMLPRKSIRPGIVVEFKYCGKIDELNADKMTAEEYDEARKKLLTESAESALEQIEKRDYIQDFKKTNLRIFKYGISFYGKEALALLVENADGRDVRKLSAEGPIPLS